MQTHYIYIYVVKPKNYNFNDILKVNYMYFNNFVQFTWLGDVYLRVKKIKILSGFGPDSGSRDFHSEFLWVKKIKIRIRSGLFIARLSSGLCFCWYLTFYGYICRGRSNSSVKFLFPFLLRQVRKVKYGFKLNVYFDDTNTYTPIN
jgi:hypothetical protein